MAQQKYKDYCEAKLGLKKSRFSLQNDSLRAFSFATLSHF